MPIGVDGCDIIAVGPGAGGNSVYGGTAGGMAIRINKPVAPGQIIAGVIGAGDSNNGPGGPTTVDGMTAEAGTPGLISNGSLDVPGGRATGGDINLTGGKSAPNAPGGLPSPAWFTDPPTSAFKDSGGPYIHPNYKGIGTMQSNSSHGAGAGSTTGGYMATVSGAVFIFYYATE